MAGHGQHGSGLREQLCYELGRVLPGVPTDKLRTLLLAARVWAHPGGYEEEDGNARRPLRLIGPVAPAVEGRTGLRGSGEKCFDNAAVPAAD